MSPFWSGFSSTLKAAQVLKYFLTNLFAWILTLYNHSLCTQARVVSLKCKSDHVTLQLKCFYWHPLCLE